MKEMIISCKIELRNITFAPCDKFNITEVHMGLKTVREEQNDNWTYKVRNNVSEKRSIWSLNRRA